MRVLPYGDTALLAEVDDPALVLPLAVAARRLDGVRETVPAATTVLVALRDGAAADAVAHALRELSGGLEPARHGGGEEIGLEVALEVDYDGPDLASTADELGLDVDDLVRLHTAGEYVVAFCGFAPGFAYLRGLDTQLHVPRLAEPRTRVPAGSVGIAGEFTGVYPRQSPGGWRLLGRTDAPLWSLDRTPPALLAPATRVRFRPR